jgi:hypothetical protein
MTRALAAALVKIRREWLMCNWGFERNLLENRVREDAGRRSACAGGVRCFARLSLLAVFVQGF